MSRMGNLVIVGASGHGKVCSEIAELMRYENILFLDDNRRLKLCGQYPVVGTKKDFRKFVSEDTDFFIGIGQADIRKGIQEEIESVGGKIARLIHPDAVVSKSVEIGFGTVIMPGTVVNTGTIIGKGCIVNTSSSIDHDCMISDYCHIAVGAHLAGTVKIGEKTWIGVGAVVSNNVNICSECTVGAGAVVIKDICLSGIYIGVPARKKEDL